MLLNGEYVEKLSDEELLMSVSRELVKDCCCVEYRSVGNEQGRI